MLACSSISLQFLSLSEQLTRISQCLLGLAYSVTEGKIRKMISSCNQMSHRERLAYGILISQHPGGDSEEIYLDVKGDAAQSDADDSHCDQGLKSCGPPPPPQRSSSITLTLTIYLHLAHYTAALA